MKCRIEHYSTEDGLSHDAITRILKDKEGFMWFGTWNGINRFDGHNFVTFKSFPGDNAELQNARIDVIVEDNKKHLWLRGSDKQIYRFDKSTERFLNVSKIINAAAKKHIAFHNIVVLSDGTLLLQTVSGEVFHVPDTRLKAATKFVRFASGGTEEKPVDIKFLTEGQDRSIWMGSSAGLFCYLKQQNGKYKKVKKFNKLLKDNCCTAYSEDDNYIYIGTSEGQLLVYHKYNQKSWINKISAGRVANLCISKKDRSLFVSTGSGELIVMRQGRLAARYNLKQALYSIYEDLTGHLWIEPEKAGVIRLNPSNGVYEQFAQAIDKGIIKSGSDYRVFEDNGGIVWVNLKGGGFGYFNRTTGKLDYFYNKPSDPNRRFSNTVYDLYYDKAGVLWLTTEDRGIFKVVFQPNSFDHKLLDSTASFASDNDIRGILYDKQKRLWLGVKNGKLYILKDNKVVPNLFLNSPQNGLGAVYAIMEDHNRNVWLGTKAKGLWKATPVDGSAGRYNLTNFTLDSSKVNNINSNQIYSVIQDRQKRIWIGSFDRGLSLVSQEGDKVKFLHTGPYFKHYPKSLFNKVRHLALDGNGRIWIGTTGGLLVLDPARGYRYKSYTKLPNNRQSIGNNDIQYIYRDAKNRMWLCTSGGGLNLAIGQDPMKSLSFKHFTIRDGLPSDYLLSCAEDKAGGLWLATQNGLSRFDMSRLTSRNFDSYDGLPRVRFSEASCVKLQSGNFIFGTAKGLISFDPDDVLKRKIPANIAFTNLQINNLDVLPSVSHILSRSINYTEKLVLKFSDNIISIDYATLDYRSRNKQSFLYRLKGFDTTWHNDQGLKRITYTNLPSGDYVLEFKSLNGEMPLRTPIKSIEIIILPPPWRTWWAYIFYFIVLSVIFEIVRRTALAMLKLRNKVVVEQQLAELKLNFFAKVSHELRTPLTLILNPVEEVFRTERLSHQGVANIDFVRKNANRMLKFVNQLLDFRKLQSGNDQLHVSKVEIVQFIREISDYFSETIKRKHIAFDLQFSEEPLLAWVDAGKLDVVIYNLLSNALKYTPVGESISVAVKSKGDSFTIEVSDRGPGVDEAKLAKIFELYYQAEESVEAEGGGTGIGLAYAKEIVEAHNGTISANNNSDRGLTVVVSLKLGKAHFDSKKVTFTDHEKATFISHSSSAMLDNDKTYKHLKPFDKDQELVLLVEDNKDLREFLKQQLTELYRVEVASDGQEGFEKALQLQPDLILSDIMMPGMDGIEMLDQLKNNEITSHIPVILLTAKFSIESQIQGLQYGADYYIPKPFNNAFLLTAIENLIKQRKRIFQSLKDNNKPIQLHRGARTITEKDEAFMKKVIAVVNNDMNNPEFNIDTVAETLGMARSTFYKKLKSLTDLAPIELVKDLRLQRGKELLDAGENNISTVAYSVGFNNPKYFGTCFKEKYGITPSAYIKKEKTA